MAVAAACRSRTSCWNVAERAVPADQQHDDGDDQHGERRSASSGAAERQPMRRAAAGRSCGASPSSGAGHRRAELLRGDRRAGRRRRRAGRAGSPAACPTGRSARRGRRRSAAPPGPSRAGVAHVVPDRGLGADVDAAGRVRGDQQPRVAAHLAADDQLLLVAAGQRDGGDVDAGRADVVLRRRCAGCPPGRPRGRSAGPRRWAPAVWWPSIRFSHSGASSSRPCRCRSSGM